MTDSLIYLLIDRLFYRLAADAHQVVELPARAGSGQATVGHSAGAQRRQPVQPRAGRAVVHDVPELLDEGRLTWLQRDAALGEATAAGAQCPQLSGAVLAATTPPLIFALLPLPEYNLRIFWTPQKTGSGGLKSPWGPGAKPRGLGTNPVGDMANEVPPEADDIFRLRGIFFTQNTSIISYFNKVGLLIFPF